MPSPFKVITPRAYVKSDGSEQTQWLTVGSAFPNQKGGFDCSLWCIPLPNLRGEVRLLIVPDDSEARRAPQPQGNAPQERQNFGGTHRDQFRGGNAAAGAPGAHTQAAEAYYPGKPDDKLPF